MKFILNTAQKRKEKVGKAKENLGNVLFLFSVHKSSKLMAFNP